MGEYYRVLKGDTRSLDYVGLGLGFGVYVLGFGYWVCCLGVGFRA